MSPPHRTHESAFTEVYEQHYADVYRFLRRRTTPDDAEDVAHEAFLVAWRRFAEIPHRTEDIRPWLFTVARNCLLNDRRGRARHDALLARITDEVAIRESDPQEGSPMLLDIVAGWRRLSVEHREALALIAWDDLSSTQAAEVLGISATAFRVRLHRARVALRRALAPTPGDVRRDEQPGPRPLSIAVVAPAAGNSESAWK